MTLNVSRANWHRLSSRTSTSFKLWVTTALHLLLVMMLISPGVNASDIAKLRTNNFHTIAVGTTLTGLVVTID